MRQTLVLLRPTLLATLAGASSAALGQERPDIRHAILAEDSPRTPQVSTSDLQRILTERSAIVFDTRPFREFAVSHIPGARNLSAKPGVSMSLYVSDAAEVGARSEGTRTRRSCFTATVPSAARANGWPKSCSRPDTPTYAAISSESRSGVPSAA